MFDDKTWADVNIEPYNWQIYEEHVLEKIHLF